MTSSLDLLHKIKENLDLLHKIQLVGKHGYFTSTSGSRHTSQNNKCHIMSYTKCDDYCIWKEGTGEFSNSVVMYPTFNWTPLPPRPTCISIKIYKIECMHTVFTPGGWKALYSVYPWWMHVLVQYHVWLMLVFVNTAYCWCRFLCIQIGGSRHVTKCLMNVVMKPLTLAGTIFLKCIPLARTVGYIS